MTKKTCSFCEAQESEENPLIAGENAYICSNCVISAYKILFGEEEQEENQADLGTHTLYTPKEINTLLDDESTITIVALPDEKKGEKLVLLLEGIIELEDLKEQIKGLAMNPLFVPSLYFRVEELPKLGSGKADFKGAKKLAIELTHSTGGIK